MTDRAVLLDALLANPARASAVPREEAVSLLIDLARVQRALELLAIPGRAPAPEVPSDRTGPGLLTVAEVADRSRKSPRWIRDNWRKEMPFGRKRGRTLLFPTAELEKWLRRP